MPIYEFQCRACGAKSTQLVGVQEDWSLLKCPACHQPALQKRISRFRVGRSEDARIEEAADRLEQMDDQVDPMGVLNQVREMGKALDEDVSDDLEDLFETDMSSDNVEGNPD